MYGTNKTFPISVACCFAALVTCFGLSNSKNKGNISGNFDKDVLQDTSGFLEQQTENGKEILHQSAQKVQSFVSQNTPLLSNTAQKITDVLEPACDRKSVPCGTFTIDISDDLTSPQQFCFDIKGKEKSGEIRLSYSEYGDSHYQSNGNIKLNIVFWNPQNPQQKGIAFLLDFKQKKGVLIRPFDNSKQTVYVANGERLCATLNNQNYQTVLISNRKVYFKKFETIHFRQERLVKAQPREISSQIQAAHQKSKCPLVVSQKKQNSRHNISER